MFPETMTHLYLRKNRLGDHGIGSVTFPKFLKELSLYGNKFTVIGALELKVPPFFNI